MGVHICLEHCPTCGSLAAGSYVISMPRGFAGLCPVRAGVDCVREQVTMGRAVVLTGMDKDTLLREICSCVDHDSPMRAEAATALGIAPVTPPGESFDEIDTRTVTEAVRTVVDRGVAAVPVIDDARLMAEFVGIRTARASNGLWTGTADDVAEVLRVNLERDLSRLPNFEAFSIEVLADAACLQVSTVYNEVFVGYRIWRTLGKIHFCGDAQTILTT